VREKRQRRDIEEKREKERGESERERGAT